MSSFDLSSSEAWFDDPPPVAQRRPSAALRRLAISTGKVLGLVLLLGVGLAVASSLVAERGPPALWPQSSAAGFAEMRRPIPIFGLTGTDFARLPLAYAAFRGPSGAARRDTLTFGDPQADKAWLKLSLYRAGPEPLLAGDFVEEVATLGRETGVEVSHPAAPTRLGTRFGAFEVADLRVSAASGSTPCLGFRSLEDAAAPLHISGLACGTASRPVARDLLACVVDRLDLLAAGDDRALRDLFVAAERRRGVGCQPSPLLQAGSRMTWLDANGSAPVLKPSPARGRGNDEPR